MTTELVASDIMMRSLAALSSEWGGTFSTSAEVKLVSATVTWRVD
jgi:hypothetical protein